MLFATSQRFYHYTLCNKYCDKLLFNIFLSHYLKLVRNIRKKDFLLKKNEKYK